MTPAEQTALADVITQTQYVLLDFDGPICSIFHGLPAPTVANQLRDLITRDGITIPAAVNKADDPFDILRFAATIDHDLRVRTEAELRRLELQATKTAQPTPHAAEVIAAARNSGRSVGVVSNNSHAAVTQYLTDHGLIHHVDPVVGRTDPDPRLLKPHPTLVKRAIQHYRAEPLTCVLVGDSTTDIEAAHAARTHSIGYANKPGKRQHLTTAGANAIITKMADLTAAFRANRPTRSRPRGSR